MRAKELLYDPLTRWRPDGDTHSSNVSNSDSLSNRAGSELISDGWTEATVSGCESRRRSHALQNRKSRVNTVCCEAATPQRASNTLSVTLRMYDERGSSVDRADDTDEREEGGRERDEQAAVNEWTERPSPDSSNQHSERLVHNT